MEHQDKSKEVQVEQHQDKSKEHQMQEAHCVGGVVLPKGEVTTTKSTRVIGTKDFPIQQDKKVTYVKGDGGNYGKYTKIISKNVDDCCKGGECNHPKYFKKEV